MLSRSAFRSRRACSGALDRDRIDEHAADITAVGNFHQAADQRRFQTLLKAGGELTFVLLTSDFVIDAEFQIPPSKLLILLPPQERRDIERRAEVEIEVRDQFFRFRRGDGVGVAGDAWGGQRH